MFETPHQTPYAFNLHVQDVGHTLVLGATGSGKSFLLNFLITHAQKYDAAHRHPRSRAQLPQARDAARRPLSRSRTAAARRHDQSVRARAHAGAPAFPARVRARAARRRRRLSAAATWRTASSTRRSRTSTCSIAASGGCSRWPTCCRARSPARLHKWVDGGRTPASSTTSTTRSRSSGSRCSTSRRCARIPCCSSRCCSTCSIASTDAHSGSREAGDAQALRDGRGVALHPAPDACAPTSRKASRPGASATPP